MTLTFDHSPGRIQMKQDGVAFFDTDAYPVMLAAPIAVNGVNFSYPDVLKGVGYGFARGLRGSDMYRSCSSIVTMGPQEWGPANMRPAADDPSRVLSETVLTTVPGACDGLLVQFNLTRTSTPSPINGITIPVLPETGQWVSAPGGSLPLEYLFPLSRQVDVVLQTDSSGAPVFNLDGTRNVVLQRRQSVNRRLYSFYRTDTMNSGWTAHGAGVGAFGHLVHPIEIRGASFTVGDGTDFSYSGSNHCSLVDPTNYASAYTADIRITPTFMNEAPENSGTTSKTGYFIGHQVLTNAARQNVWNFDPMVGGAPHPTRYVYILVSASNNATVTSAISSVEVNGLPATPLVAPFDNSNIIDWAVFYINLPAGDDISIKVTLSGAAQSACYVSAHVAYNLSSPTSPFNLVNSDLRSTPTSPNISVATTPGAVCLFMAAQAIAGPFPTFGGLINPGFRGPATIEDPIYVGGFNLTGWAATEIASGSSIGVKAEVDEDAAGSSNAALANYRWFAVVLI